MFLCFSSWLYDSDGLAVAKINARLEAVTQLSVATAEGLQVCCLNTLYTTLYLQYKIAEFLLFFVLYFDLYLYLQVYLLLCLLIFKF